jgi:hypothetical protein
MIPECLLKRGVRASGNMPFVGAAPQTANAPSVNMSDVHPGTLSARCTVRAETSTLTVTHKWQVQDKTGTWIDVAYDSNNPAPVVLATGTAGADAPITKVIPAPLAVYAYRAARIVFFTGVGVGAGAGQDEVSCDYYYVNPLSNG